MTQKELLYVEDAIGHEKNIISICNETVNMLEEDDLVSFMELRIQIGLNIFFKWVSCVVAC